MKKQSLLLILLICFSTLLSLKVFAKNNISDVKVLVVGQQIQGNIYTIPEKENTFLLPLEETAKLLGANVYVENDGQKVSVILLNFPQMFMTYTDSTLLSSTQYTFDGISGKVITFGESTALHYPPQTSPIMIDGVMYLSSEDIARMFNQDVFYNTSKNIYNIGYYAINGSGEHEGWQLLKGYPLEEKYNYYFKEYTEEGFKHTAFDSEILNPPNMNDIVTFTFQDKSYTMTRQEAYNFLSTIDTISGNLQAIGADKAAMDISRSTSGQVDDEYYEMMSDSSNLIVYYNRYNSWVMRLAKKEKLRDFITEEEYKKQIQEKEKQKALEIAAEDINTYAEGVKLEWENLNKPQFSEWETLDSLRRNYDLSFLISTEKNYEWEVFLKNRKIDDLPFPIENIYSITYDNTVYNSGNIRIKAEYSEYFGSRLKFNVYDLEKKGYITINQNNFKPPQGKYVNDKIKEYINNKYPEIDPVAFYRAY